jgi:hypothetical protein
MNVDRELLELAAKAAGIEFTWVTRNIQVGVPDTYGVRQYREEPCPMIAGLFWSPLTDDGDALRLALNVPEISLQWAISEGWLAVGENAARHAATRRAIVEAAAEVGRSLP